MKRWSRSRVLSREADGNPRVWWHWQDLRKDSRPAHRWPHGRAWLHTGRNTFGVEWVVLPRRWRLGVSLGFEDRGDEELSGRLHLLLLSLYWSVHRARWVRRLPGVAWAPHALFSGEHNGHREIGFSVDRERLWLYPWVHSDGGSRRHTILVDWADLFLGRSKYSKQVIEAGVPVVIPMPEGDYPGTAKRYIASWKRPRWPWPKRAMRVEIDVPQGVPFPGKGENDWDLGEDAISNSTTCAETIEAAVQQLVASVMRDRRRYGEGEDWRPEAKGGAG